MKKKSEFSTFVPKLHKRVDSQRKEFLRAIFVWKRLKMCASGCHWLNSEHWTATTAAATNYVWLVAQQQNNTQPINLSNMQYYTRFNGVYNYGLLKTSFPSADSLNFRFFGVFFFLLGAFKTFDYLKRRKIHAFDRVGRGSSRSLLLCLSKLKYNHNSDTRFDSRFSNIFLKFSSLFRYVFFQWNGKLVLFFIRCHLAIS